MKKYSMRGFIRMVGRSPGMRVTILKVQRATVDDMPALLLTLRPPAGEDFGLVLRHDPASRKFYEDLTAMAGRQDEADRFFNLQ